MDKAILSQVLSPFWEGNTIYNETATFIGEEDSVTLIYEPEKIISVQNYGLDKEYKEGIDYLIKDGKITRIKGGGAPYFKYDEYYRDTPDTYAIKVSDDIVKHNFDGEKYLAFGEKDYCTSRQIAVTYVHNGNSAVGEILAPLKKNEKFSRFNLLLTNKTPVSVVFYGDSITLGCNSSGTIYGGNIAPNLPSFAELTVEYIKTKYNVDINFINSSKGGEGIDWGIENVEERVNKYLPDLLVIGFGMNNGGMQPEEFRCKMRSLIEKARENNKNCEILLLAGIVPNIESNWFKNQVLFLNELKILEKEFKFTAVADITSVHLALLNYGKGKRYADLTGNNVNHPNDFLARIYAQTILQTILD